MADVQSFIDTPGDRDVPVHQIFSQQHFDELKQMMSQEGWDVSGTEARWRDDFKDRRIITEFLKDPSLGDKRLASMPDRVTNTINTGDSGVLCRPAVINCYEGDLGNLRKWWHQWKGFMFNHTLRLADGSTDDVRPIQMLKPIKRSKYPALTPEEEAMSLPLQTLAQAIFDAILVHIVNSVSPNGRWQGLRQEMCDALNRHKDERTLTILASTYADADIVFLQESAVAFQQKAKADPAIGSRYIVARSATFDKSRDQNSLVLLNKERFVESTIEDHTATVMSSFTTAVPVASGDLFVLSVADKRGERYLFASFHGDTNGLATKPVFAAVDQLARTMPDRTLIFGLDANTYEAVVPGKLQNVLDFAQDYFEKGYTSCWGDMPDPKNHTTYNARTYLQAQLQKAAKRSETATKGDKNPKDFIIFPKGTYKVLRTQKDNTGERRYVEDMVFPTLQFPSDHGVLSTTLEEL
mmetsp:Transcript_6680/g.20216  ORF Transcript_6680/g.20216 Transcript_6680/m.20216 type:complete len:467 (-) Transcript_6680:636-2036(-)